MLLHELGFLEISSFIFRFEIFYNSAVSIWWSRINYFFNLLRRVVRVGGRPSRVSTPHGLLATSVHGCLVSSAFHDYPHSAFLKEDLIDAFLLTDPLSSVILLFQLSDSVFILLIITWPLMNKAINMPGWQFLKSCSFTSTVIIFY